MTRGPGETTGARKDPLGKRALFSPPPVPPTDHHLDDDPMVGGGPPEGVGALYSAGPRRPGTVVLECSRCLNHTRMSVVEAGVRVAFVSVWVPGKHFSRWVQCPECERRTWCRIHWTG
jgi:hypothetical protein